LGKAAILSISTRQELIQFLDQLAELAGVWLVDDSSTKLI
jgi:hypothetical protein